MWLFGKRRKGQQSEIEQNKKEEGDQLDVEVYSGMRVEVTTADGFLLFVAKLVASQTDQMKLLQYSETELSKEVLRRHMEAAQQEAQCSETDTTGKVEPFHVRIRGYDAREKRAVYMEGDITPEEGHTWIVKSLTVGRIGNERAFFRLTTNLDVVITALGGFSAGEENCKMLNISVGGTCILSERKYHEGDKFLLNAQLLEDRPTSVMFCEVLRIVEREDSKYEYGCRFLELNEEDQDKITQNIFAVQLEERRKQRERS